MRIDVGRPDNAWVVNKKRYIYRRTGNRWRKMPGRVMDIGVGANGKVWVIGTNKESGGYGIYRWSGRKWVTVKGSAVRIDVDPKGPFGTNNGNNIYRSASVR